MILVSADIKFITLAVRGGGHGGGARLRAGTNVSDLMKTLLLLLHWSDSLPRPAYSQGECESKERSGEAGKQEGENGSFAKLRSKEMPAIKPQSQLIGRCYPGEFITGAWENRPAIFAKCLHNQKGHHLYDCVCSRSLRP